MRKARKKELGSLAALCLALLMGQTALGVITVPAPIMPDVVKPSTDPLDTDDGVLFIYGKAVANNGDTLDAIDYDNRNANNVMDQLPFSKFDGADGRDPSGGDAGIPGSNAEFVFTVVYDLSGTMFTTVGPADNQLKGISFGMGLLDGDTGATGDQVQLFEATVNGNTYDLTAKLNTVLNGMPLGNRVYQTVASQYFLNQGNASDVPALNDFLMATQAHFRLVFTQPSLIAGGVESQQGNGVGFDIFALGFNEPGKVPNVDIAQFIPEPATGLMALLGLGAIALRRRRAA